MPSPTTFSLSHEPIRASSPIVEVMTPPVASAIEPPVCPSLSPRDFLCTIIEEGNIEAVSEALSTEVVASEVLAPAASEVETPLDVPSLELVKYEKRMASLVSHQANFKKDDLLLSEEIRVIEDEVTNLQARIALLKTQRSQQ
ncbi:hypothetical protein AMTR_s00044p00190800 [Amborella trichopoda]|uniref:Uncharacterized protein n=1 Tax=Amborella trichopoda TaxID=13333 RepID=U5D468_AMBTC|nr:hypothetical protein AMTR_s00044p00190800 [Amborella trichopoda]